VQGRSPLPHLPVLPDVSGVERSWRSGEVHCLSGPRPLSRRSGPLCGPLSPLGRVDRPLSAQSVAGQPWPTTKKLLTKLQQRFAVPSPDVIEMLGGAQVFGARASYSTSGTVS